MWHNMHMCRHDVDMMVEATTDNLMKTRFDCFEGLYTALCLPEGGANSDEAAPVCWQPLRMGPRLLRLLHVELHLQVDVQVGVALSHLEHLVLGKRMRRCHSQCCSH
jgi:hypothetical protein